MRKMLAILMALVLFLQLGLCAAFAENETIDLSSLGESAGSGGETAEGTEEGSAGFSLDSLDLSNLDLDNLDLGNLGLDSLDLGALGDLDLSALGDLDLSALGLGDLDLSSLDLSNLDLSSLDLSALDLSSLNLDDLTGDDLLRILDSLGLGAEPQGLSEPIVKASIFVDATADGPEATKVILELENEAAEIAVSGLTMNIAGQNREPGQVYLCDENGEPAAPSRWVAFDIGDIIPDETEEEESSSGGFSMAASLFARTDMSISVWADEYQVILSADEFVVDGAAYALSVDENCIGNRICPSAALFNYRAAWTGTYLNQITGEMEEQTVSMAAYEPDSLAGGEKNPLIIWLHGQGEGGHDPDIAILGNEVSALAKDPIQGYFSAGEQIGAYVLVPQIETYWMDEGDDTNGQGAGVSRYTQALMDAINDYLAHNDDVDVDRIYLGGCSNGGYMTLNMLVEYPGVFAAAYPICEAYSYYAYIKEGGRYVESQNVQDSSGGSAGDSSGEPAAEEPAEAEEAAEPAPAEETADSNGDSNGDSAGDPAGDSAGDPAMDSAGDPAAEAPAEEAEPAAAEPQDAEEIDEIVGNGNCLIDPDTLWVDAEKVQLLKDVPIWFVLSEDDFLVSPELYELPTYAALIQAGAENCYLSVFSGYGHGVWVALFQNLVTGAQNPADFLEAEIFGAGEASIADYLIQAADNGGSYSVNGYESIFAWLNAQSK